MNFDDLHDPAPPRAGSATLAAVAGRARRIRRRRTALISVAGVLAAAVVVVPIALVATGDHASERLVPATVPDTPPPSVLPGSTLPGTTPTPTVPTTPPAAAIPALVAIDAAGDAVYLPQAGEPIVLYDGPDPDEQPTEGELATIDSVVMTHDGTRAWVTTCCEPVPGTWQAIEVGTGPVEGATGYGRGFELSPDGTRLSSVGYYEIAIRDLDGQPVVTTQTQDIGAETARRQYIEALPSVVPAQPQDIGASPSVVTAQPQESGAYAVEITWIDDNRLAVLSRLPNSLEIRLNVVTPETLDSFDDAGVPAPGTTEDYRNGKVPTFAGRASTGEVLVLDTTTRSNLIAYDPVTLARVSGSDVALPGPAIDVWFADGVLTWVGADRRLHVGDEVVPGEFLWARPL